MTGEIVAAHYNAVILSKNHTAQNEKAKIVPMSPNLIRPLIPKWGKVTVVRRSRRLKSSQTLTDNLNVDIIDNMQSVSIFIHTVNP